MRGGIGCRDQGGVLRVGENCKQLTPRLPACLFHSPSSGLTTALMLFSIPSSAKDRLAANPVLALYPCHCPAP